MSKRLSDAQVAQYQSDGYAAPVDLFTPEETAARKSMAHLVQGVDEYRHFEQETAAPAADCDAAAMELHERSVSLYRESAAEKGDTSCGRKGGGGLIRRRWRAPNPAGVRAALVRFAALAALVLVPAALAAQTSPIPETMLIPAGAFIAGSNRAEREAAYRLDERAYGHSVTRRARWYENESPRANLYTGAYFITRTLITNTQYAAFVAATGYAAPDVYIVTWEGYGLNHPYSRTRRHAWKGARPPLGRDDHPVVLVSYADARAYADWLGRVSLTRWRLPTEKEWEKAARGTRGGRFPWGDAFDPARANSADQGPFDTTPVNRHPGGASPFGVMDAAGQVFEWTATPAGGGRFIVKGGSWDDKGCGICRPAARQARPAHLKHILIGFRLVRETASSAPGRGLR